MNEQRRTLGPDIYDCLSGRVPAEGIIEILMVERAPIEAAAPKVGDEAWAR